jgi:phage pi2 protein 07
MDEYIPDWWDSWAEKNLKKKLSKLRRKRIERELLLPIVKRILKIDDGISDVK